MKNIVILLFVCYTSYLAAQPSASYWQQEVQYKMDIDVDVKKNQFTGIQELEYTNNSPDTLNRVFYHLYYNAFQPGSVMDERNKYLPDVDPRVGDRIPKLRKKEIGFHDIKSLKLGKKTVTFNVNGTILECFLPNPILPGETVTLRMEFLSQIPLQIRRTGRDNKEGVRYSMSQWYPKICEYDAEGWHPNPYIGREFHSPWGDFEVNITIDKSYVLGATGVLLNYNEVGKGYQAIDLIVPEPEGDKITWQYKAENVIDFVWAADPDYVVKMKKAYDGTRMYFVYQPGEETNENWSLLPNIMDEALQFMNKRYGKYPYPQYSFIQGGDGGMEYPMATLITGNRNLGSLVGVSVHEWMHSWYQFMLATNEALYPWMDEGFTTFGTNETMNYLRTKGVLKGEVQENEHARSYLSYGNLANSGQEEALSTHSDHYMTNTAYGIGSYSKGNVFLNQVEYILGEEVFAKALHRYFNEWKFKHPTPKDFIRIMEKESGFVLDWYLEYFVYTTKQIDYTISSVSNKGLIPKAEVTVQRIGEMPMPLDVLVEYTDGSKEIYYIPLDIMRGEKSQDSSLYPDLAYNVLQDWNWVNKEYVFKLKKGKNKIKSIDINPSMKLADINPDNNIFENN